MRRWRVAVNLGVFAALFVLMAVWAVRNVVSVERIERPYTLHASFENAFGVLPNAEVTYLGVSSGSVSAVEREPGGVRVSMRIRRDLAIPAGSTAHIRRKSAIGEQYVDFEPPPGPPTGTVMRPGEVVPRERTSVPLEFSELLRSASDLLRSVPPGDVGGLVHEAAVGLSGRADSLRALVDAGDRVSAALAARTEALDRLAGNGAVVTGVLADHRDSLGASVAALRAVADSLAAVDGDVRRLLDTAPALARQVADLVGDHKAELDCDLRVLEAVVDGTTTDFRLRGLAALLDHGPAAFAGVWDSRDVEADGPWVRVGLVNNANNPPRQYVPPAELPPVRPVPDCASSLRPAGVDYRPEPDDGPDGVSEEASLAWALAMSGALAALVLREVGPGLRSGA